MSEFYKSVGEILGENNWVKVAKDLGSLYPNAQLPENFDASNPYVAAAGQLMNDARMIVAIHENSTLHQNGVPPLVDEDYIVLAQKHGDLAEQHRQFAMQLQAANPTGYIQAISGHGDAYGAHLDAQRVAFMMAPVVVDQHWDGKHGQILPARWNTENEVWRAAHRAFLMSQQAFNRTSFDTGVAKSMGESLADVIRHDQDHDDWHAMHGDPPCKSEADCARMRAKYTEVKAEEAANVSKGDVVGHEFHGNQYTHGAASTALRSIASAYDKRGGKNAAENKRRYLLAGRLAQRIEKDPSKSVEEHIDAQRGELEQDLQLSKDYLAQLNRIPSALQEVGDGRYEAKQDVADSQAKLASHDAVVGLLTQRLEGSRTGVIKSEVKVQKGDVPGHEFHGNQYAEARSANDHLKIANNLHLQHDDEADPESVSAQHEIAASLHRDMSSKLRDLAQKALDSQHPITSSSLRHAAELHAEAAQAHEEAAKVTAEKGIGQESIDAAFPAVRASRGANEATDQALNLAGDTGLAPVSSSFPSGAPHYNY